MLENVLLRYLAENFLLFYKELPAGPMKKNLCDGVLFNEIAGVNSRPAIH